MSLKIFRNRCRLKIFLFCSVELNRLCNFSREHYGEYSREIFVDLDQWFKRRCCLKKKFMKDPHKMKTDPNSSY